MRRCLQSASDVSVEWRRIWRLSVVAVVLLMAAGSVWLADAGRYERACSPDELNGRRTGVCGSRLGDLLRVVCRSVYNKRSADCENHSLPRFLLHSDFSRSMGACSAVSIGLLSAWKSK